MNGDGGHESGFDVRADICWGETTVFH